MLEPYVSVLKEEEGFTPHVMPDTRGVFVGHGCRVDPDGPGLSREAAECDLRVKLDEAMEDMIVTFPAWWFYGEARQSALISMRYQLGRFGFLAFSKMIEAVRDERWNDASEECLDSKAARNPLTEKRFARNARALRTDEWQWECDA
jgi:GH24 family phage-related lysozyme (muramidase)